MKESAVCASNREFFSDEYVAKAMSSAADLVYPAENTGDFLLKLGQTQDLRFARRHLGSFYTVDEIPY